MQPIKSYIQAKTEDNYYTQDMPHILSKRRHLLFVYGTLKKGFVRHGMLQQQKPMFVGDGWTQHSTFQMEYTNSLSPYPVVLPNYSGAGGQIHGEVYLVTPATIVACDFVESNGHYYDRRKTNICITNENNPGLPLVIDCWMYEGNRKHWFAVKKKTKLAVADPLIRNKTSKKYFTFMKKYVNGKPNAAL
jgi:gamma-glutamylcyclotransferase (GGCT)/AIG2-like uncharacterized protein YtfP